MVDHCLDGPFDITGVKMVGCGFWARGDNRRVTNVDMEWPTYRRTIDMRDPVAGPAPNVTTLEGDHGVISNFSMRYAYNGGLKIVGSHNLIDEALHRAGILKRS